MYKLYLAGPFFNTAQREAAEKVLSIAREHWNGEIYAPLEGGIEVDTPEKAREVFKRNVDELNETDCLLCHTDWLSPQGEEVRVLREFPVGPPLNLPDAGTIWEMGYAYRFKMQTGTPMIVAYSVLETTTRLNLMLQLCADGFLHGWTEVAEFLMSKELREDQKTHSTTPI